MKPLLSEANSQPTFKRQFFLTLLSVSGKQKQWWKSCKEKKKIKKISPKVHLKVVVTSPFSAQ